MQPDLTLVDLCGLIRHYHRQRQYAMNQRKRSDNALGAFLRIQLGWTKELIKKDSDRVKARVVQAIEAGEQRRKTGVAPDDEFYEQWQLLIDGTLAARTPFDALESAATREMERLAKRLPVWAAWAADARGFGAVSLAAIVGEAGDLDGYATHSKLWKRMGLAVMGDVRQGGLKKTAKAADWITHGYSKQRRSIMWVIGDVLIKQRETATYRQHYLARKAIEVEKAAARGQIVEPASKRTKEQPDKFMSAMHVHRRAQRWVEKRLLRDLWRAWKVASSAIADLPEKTKDLVPTGATNDGHRRNAQEAEACLPSSQSAIVAMPAGAEAELPSGTDDGQVALADQASDTARVAKGELPGTSASLCLPPASIDDGLTTDAVEAVPNLPSSAISDVPDRASVLVPTSTSAPVTEVVPERTIHQSPSAGGGATARTATPGTAKHPMPSPRQASA